MTSGTELAHSESFVQHNFDATGWTYVDGLSVTFATTDSPVWLRANFGVGVISGVGVGNIGQVQIGIVDDTNQAEVAYATAACPPELPEGYNSANFGEVFARIPAGKPKARYYARIKASVAGSSGYLTPSWLAFPTTLTAIEA